MARRWWSKGNRPRRHDMMLIPSIKRQPLELLLITLNAAKPKGDDDFLENAAFRKIVKATVGFDEDRGVLKLEDVPKEGVDLQVEDSTFRYLEKVFKATRDAGEVYLGSGSELVVELMGVFKTVKKIELPKLVEKKKE
jgi:hypothetical protein